MTSAAPTQEGQERQQGKQWCICGRAGGYLTWFERWNEKEKQYVLMYVSKPPPSHSAACKKDRLEAKRYSDTPDHIYHVSGKTRKLGSRKSFHYRCRRH